MSYFKDFPLVAYSFGSGEQPVAFTGMNVYVDIVDQVKDQISAYRYYYIQEGDRPDILSNTLYDDQSFYWTFFLLNDHLRESGWPLTESRLVEKVTKDHPDYVISTKNPLNGIFKIGQTVRGSSSGQTGTVTFRNLDLGQLFLTGVTGNFISDEVVTSQVGNEVQSIRLHSAVSEINAIDHYIDGDGKRVDIDPYEDAPAIFTPVTKLEKYRARNTDLKRIKVLTPDVVTQVAAQFQDELRS